MKSVFIFGRGGTLALALIIASNCQDIVTRFVNRSLLGATEFTNQIIKMECWKKITLRRNTAKICIILSVVFQSARSYI